MTLAQLKTLSSISFCANDGKTRPSRNILPDKWASGIDRYIPICFFFLLGLNKHVALIAGLFLLYLIARVKPLEIKNTFFSFSGLFVAFVVLFVGSLLVYPDRMTVANPYVRSITLLIVVTVFGYALSGMNLSRARGVLEAYLFGMGLDVLLVVGYSYWVNKVSYGYGALLDVWTGQVVNSPAYGNMLIYLFAPALCLMSHSRSLFRGGALFFLLLASLLGAFFLAGRVFFIVSFFALLLLFVLRYRWLNNGIRLLVLFSILYVILSLFASHYKYLPMADFLYGPLRGKGLSSLRWDVWVYGIGQLFVSPLGGYKANDILLNHSIWFHNIILDSARLGGLLSVLFFVAMFFVASRGFVKGRTVLIKSIDGVFVTLLFFSSLMIMMQDVVIEGEYRSWLLFVFSSLIMIKVGETGSVQSKGVESVS